MEEDLPFTAPGAGTTAEGPLQNIGVAARGGGLTFELEWPRFLVFSIKNHDETTRNNQKKNQNHVGVANRR